MVRIVFTNGTETRPSNEKRLETLHTKNLPYWLSAWAQNTSYNFGFNTKNQSDVVNPKIPWYILTLKNYTQEWLKSGQGTPPKLVEVTATAVNLRTFALNRWWVKSRVKTRQNIPFIYKSK